MVTDLLERGWAWFPEEVTVADWAEAALDVAQERVQDPEEQRQWLQCDGTWFVGVDTLPNDTRGDVGASGPLAGEAFRAASDLYGVRPLHSGQVSVIYPGYPRPREGEGEAAFGYRLRRDAAHVDGLLATGPARQRMLKERHAYILGLPLTSCSADASPLVIWEGSHRIMQAAFDTALGHLPEDEWEFQDLTETYQAARRQAFETCPRITLPAQPGESYLVHRHCLHGVAPWGDQATASDLGRIIAYFRPEFPAQCRDWLTAL